MSGDHIVTGLPENPRAGWDEDFAKMRERGDDVLPEGDGMGLSSWDEEEWEWGGNRMSRPPSDTSPEAERVLIEGYRRMSPAEKLERV